MPDTDAGIIMQYILRALGLVLAGVVIACILLAIVAAVEYAACEATEYRHVYSVWTGCLVHVGQVWYPVGRMMEGR